MEGFSITVAAKAGDRVVVAAAGELDLASADRLWERLEPLITDGTTVVLDCAEVGFMDSTGMRVLLRAAKAAETKGGTFRLSAPQPAVLRVIELAGIGALIPVFADTTAALAP